MKRIRWFSFLLLVGIQGIFSSLGGSAEPSRTLSVATAQEKGGRVAIVIGNSKYPSGALVNPMNDATAMAGALKKLGFDVELKLDATKADIDGMLRRFSGKAEKATVAALFYAGHGIQVGGSNYLVPIDANPRSEKDLKRDMVKMDDIIDDMGDARVKLVFFDACRDNPLSRSFSRGGSRGMAAPVEATGTLISFATKHGNTAADGDGKHSPYTNAMLAALENPSGVEIEQLLRRVQQGVKAETKGQQEPWRYGSLDGDFYFRAADPTDSVKTSQEAVDKAVLEAMRQANDKAARDKAELQQSIKAQQEASERASQEALKRANEQAARDKAELQQTLKAQQAASERAMGDALRKVSEQAARERAEMQASMDKMLKEALARQNAAIQAERVAAGVSARAPIPVTQSPAPQAGIQTPPPIQLASIAPTGTGGGTKPAGQVPGALSSALGDEWEYVVKDIFGAQQKVVGRVKAVVPGAGVLEEYSVDGKSSGEWVFDGKPSLIGLPIDAGFLFSPHWEGKEIDTLQALNGSRCGAMCGLSAKVLGSEKVTVPAGTFETRILSISVSLGGQGVVNGLHIEAWYSVEHGRIVKQIIKGYGHPSQRISKANETLELAAIRLGAR